MVDVAVLVATVVGRFLVPLFAKGTDKVVDSLAESGGQAAADGVTATARSLWEKIKARFDSDKEKSTVTLFEADPQPMETMLSKVLEERLEHDDELLREIADLVNAPVADTGKTSWQIVADTVGVVDARGSVVKDDAIVAGVVVGQPHRAGRPGRPGRPGSSPPDQRAGS